MARSITLSVLVGEIITFLDILETALAFVAKIKIVLSSNRVPILFSGDNNSLLDVISKTKRALKCISMLDT